MKKFLFFTLAVLLVVAFTLPAAAKTTFNVSGLAKSRAFYLSNPGAGDEDLTNSAHFLDMYYVLNFSISPGGAANFVATFEGLQKRWGNSGWPYGALYTTDTDHNAGQDSVFRNDARWTRALITYYAQPIGYFHFGRSVDVPGSIGGMQKSKVNAQRYHEDRGYNDRFYWQNTWGKFTAKYFFQKIMEFDATNGTQDEDYDLHWAKFHYNWKSGEVWLNLGWYIKKWYENIGAPFKDNEYKINVGGFQNFGPLTIGGYVSKWLGTREWYTAGVADQDIDAWDWYFTAEYKAGPLLAGFMYTHMDGQDDSNDITTHSSTGWWFNPLYAAFGIYDGIMFATPTSTGWSTSGDRNLNGVDDATGIDFIYFFADYNLTEKLIIHGAYGYIMADFTDGNTDDALGHEVDFAVAYNLTKGLTVGVYFGYFMPLDGWEDLNGGTADNHLHLSGEIKLEF
ncbi:MAG: hypothetical protein JRG97_16760 [Deltaproteobacteria bacterium]|nr:hypothetical protein [Deltaproteobacteria bacterium]MBW2142677.1 hypothetical protein [Deltaproteobacteria bacterium]